MSLSYRRLKKPSGKHRHRSALDRIMATERVETVGQEAGGLHSRSNGVDLQSLRSWNPVSAFRNEWFL